MASTADLLRPSEKLGTHSTRVEGIPKKNIGRAKSAQPAQLIDPADPANRKIQRWPQPDRAPGFHRENHLVAWIQYKRIQYKKNRAATCGPELEQPSLFTESEGS